MGNTQPGDGWKHRGRGLKQLTGKNKYLGYMLAAGIDCLEHPGMLLEPLHAADSAAWFWHENGCGPLADAGDIKALTRRINGGLTGPAERTARIAAALKTLAYPLGDWNSFAKATGEAITKTGIWDDGNQVVTAHEHKRYVRAGETPHTRVRAHPISVE